MTMLTSTISDEDLRMIIDSNDKTGLADFIVQRFTERFFDPIFKAESAIKHGFTIMAISCLTIEAFESLLKGWNKTDKDSRSYRCFDNFFNRENGFKEFTGSSITEGSKYNNLVEEFYDNIRCGILHQSEARGGWKIVRRGDFVLDKDAKTLNATRFHKRLYESIVGHMEKLRQEHIDSEEWQLVIKKLNHIIENCQ